MNLLHDAYTALLSGLTTKTGNEIHWEDEEGNPITVEPIDIEKEKYIVRRYHENGNKHWEDEYKEGKLHGKSISWDGNGNKEWEAEYQDDKQHGKEIGWYENGNKQREEEWQDGKLIRERLYKQLHDASDADYAWLKKQLQWYRILWLRIKALFNRENKKDD